MLLHVLNSLCDLVVDRYCGARIDGGLSRESWRPLVCEALGDSIPARTQTTPLHATKNTKQGEHSLVRTLTTLVTIARQNLRP